VDDKKVLVGTGAYRLESYDGDGGAMLYVARDGYFLGKPFVQRVEWLGISDQAHVNAVLSADTDVARAPGLRDDTLAPFRRDDVFGMVADQGAMTFPLYWNMGKEGALSDVRFRRACALAIDRRELVARLAGGKGMPGNPGFLSPANPFFTPVPQYELDVAGANALLDGDGYRPAADGIRQDERGRRLSFELLMDNYQAPLSELLVAALRRVGVELRPKLVEVGPQLFGNKFTGTYDMAVLFFPGPGPGGPNADPDILRRLFSSDEPPSLQGASIYVNRAFDALAQKQRVTFDERERRDIVAQMQLILADDLPVLPLYYPEVTMIFRKRVLDQWYFTPGQFPSPEDNKQLLITGQKTGTAIRSAK
jgi:peptide/nickel transport system substrate-binding protein